MRPISTLMLMLLVNAVKILNAVPYAKSTLANYVHPSRGCHSGARVVIGKILRSPSINLGISPLAGRQTLLFPSTRFDQMVNAIDFFPFDDQP
jgi:hypothetical protein